MTRCDVLIIGAGPTGLVLALWLTKLGVKLHIIDKTSTPGTTSRALAVQARTLELYRQLDLADAVIANGHKVPAVNLWVKGERKARVMFETIGSDLTPFPFLHIFPQDQHERLLIERLEQLGVSVQRETELLRFADEGDRVLATLRGPDGAEQTWETQYLAGCDGARSQVRETLGTGFPGGTYKQVFYVADVDASGPSLDGQFHIDLDEADFLAVFPLAGEGHARLIGTVRDERAEHPETLRFENVSQRAIEHLKVTVKQVHWFSTYRVHHRVTEHFRHGRAFLLGDAAHIHSPAGGQGMNTGIGDAINLAWKLAAAVTGQASDDLLDSYEAERIGFAHRLVATTDRVFTFATAEGRIADIVRTRLAPVVIPTVLRFDAMREFLFRTVSQITLNYRGCPWSEGSAGEVHGGDRLPWAAAGDRDNFSTLAAMTWQVHVYGSANAALREWCVQQDMPLHVFDWQPEHQAAGFARDALYLIRPDTYVAMADPQGRPEAVDNYFTRHGIKLRPAHAILSARSDNVAHTGALHES
ncbi:FAD-dependent monooxygenase [Dyella nitratireducens]|uniref:2-polyprenyl-6-methoxyphenol hydroxylase n=1 Tax=Dyella nitratireducens TaxID=1849580 RepID=A0ABQ1FUT4_9GAMM|nr:FAD-dependent monooxygenase [Dyella nitratireducens]GGA30416.1 2-polyprenyl-6-methoxyphenol hydroxylase [Dyella nitratireducens]GLQ43009.1 2-polyprenyl-6-methoxyphenol hydroxylase [Dyella nitratireducens]